MRNWKFEIAGHSTGTALPTETNAIVSEFVTKLKGAGLNVQTFNANLDGRNVDMLKEAGVEAAAPAASG